MQITNKNKILKYKSNYKKIMMIIKSKIKLLVKYNKKII